MEGQDIQIISEEPKAIIEHGRRGAVMLKRLIEGRKDKVTIAGKTYLQFQDWQTIARFYGSTASIEWTKPLMKGEVVFGWEAKAQVLNSRGLVLSNAESSCSRDEPTWKDRPDFQLRSMAQTRACAKALRNVYSWVAVLAGYEGTPAEEMTDINPTPLPKELLCSFCGQKVPQKVFEFSMDKYGRSLCFVHQKQLDTTGKLEGGD